MDNKIIFITDLDLSKEKVAGIWLYCKSIIPLLNNYSTTIVGKQSEDKFAIFADETISISEDVSNIKLLIRLFLKRKLISKQGILHAQRPDLMVPFIFRKQRKIVTLHGNPKKLIKQKGVIKWLLYTFLEKITLPKCEKIVFIDSETKKDYEKDYPSLKKNFVLIPSGVDTKLFKFNRNSERDSFLFVGRLAPEKQVDKLIGEFKQLSTKNKLLIIGSGPLENNLKNLSNDDKRIHFIGAIGHNKLPAYFSRAKGLFIFSSSEGLPLTALEALSSGVPVISTPVGELTNLLKNGKTGILIKNESLENFEKKLEKINPEDCVRQAKKYSWNEIVKKLEMIYG